MIVDPVPCLRAGIREMALTSLLLRLLKDLSAVQVSVSKVMNVMLTAMMCWKIGLWVDDPDPTYFKSHRALKRYARELKMITDVMREYSGRQEDNNQLLLDKTLEYGLRAHGIYNNALHQWLEDNPEAHSRPLVQNLVKEYRKKESEDLKRYYDRVQFSSVQFSSVQSLKKARMQIQTNC